MKLILGGLVLCALALVACSGDSKPTPNSARPKDAAETLGFLKATGLPIGASLVYTAETDVNKLLGRPNQYTSKVNFNDTRLKASESFDSEAGGSVEFFPDKQGAAARKDYIDALGKKLPIVAEYSWVQGTVLLRVSKSLTPEQAEAYHAALAKLP